MTEVHGILNVIKPLQWTSMDVVRLVKRLTRQKSVGHAGTLDPQATGILPICLGQATRVMEYLVDSPKSYHATVKLGVSTDTYDAQGQVTDVKDPSQVTREDVDKALEAFRGVFYQVPPMYSALKREGERLYNLARAGKEVSREARRVEAFRVEITSWNPPEVELEVDCGRGLYIRSLAYDMGVALGCGASLSGLSRTNSGPFNMASASTVEDIEQACSDCSWESLLYPIDFPLIKLKAGMVQRDKEEAVKRGQGIYLGFPAGVSPVESMYRLYNADGAFIALLRPDRVRGKWRAQKVFTPQATLR